jgi:hypothetical protein
MKLADQSAPDSLVNQAVTRRTEPEFESEEESAAGITVELVGWDAESDQPQVALPAAQLPSKLPQPPSTAEELGFRYWCAGCKFFGQFCGC